MSIALTDYADTVKAVASAACLIPDLRSLRITGRHGKPKSIVLHVRVGDDPAEHTATFMCNLNFATSETLDLMITETIREMFGPLADEIELSEDEVDDDEFEVEDDEDEDDEGAAEGYQSCL